MDRIDSPNVGILLDTYHMNIEEDDLAQAVHTAGDSLRLFHVADSNRRGIGLGHVSFPEVFRSLAEIQYAGPVIVECTAPGPDPFSSEKPGEWEQQLVDDLCTSRRALGRLAKTLTD